MKYQEFTTNHFLNYSDVDHEISKTNVSKHSIKLWVLFGVRNRVLNILFLEKETQ